MSKIGNWFSALSRKGKIATIVGASLLGLTAVGAASPQTQQSQSQSKPSAPSLTQPQQTTPKVEKKKVTEKAPVAFGTTARDDSALAKGSSKTIQEGVDGERTVTYEVTYTDGKETGRTKLSDEITKAPIDKIVANGTYVAPAAPTCPNGTYTNSAGNVVCSPYSASSVPAGATAKCGDGTYSFSQSRSGTCSHHGGVTVWY